MIYIYLLANCRTMPFPQIQSTVPGYDESETRKPKETGRIIGHREGEDKHGAGATKRRKSSKITTRRVMIGCHGEGRRSDLSRRGGDQPANGGEILVDSGV